MTSPDWLLQDEGEDCPECGNTGACNGGPCPLQERMGSSYQKMLNTPLSQETMLYMRERLADPAFRARKVRRMWFEGDDDGAGDGDGAVR